MSILNVNKISAVGGGSTITIAGIASVTNNISVGNSVTAGSFVGPIEGAVTGNVTGNVTGDVTGNTSGSSGSCTGNAATATLASGITTTASINTSGIVTATSFSGSGANLTSLPASGKGTNLFINGAMAIDQRRSGAAEDFASSLVWIVDRFFAQEEGTQNRITVQQVAVTADTDPWNAGFRKAGKITNGNQNDGPVAAAGVHFHYKFEAQDIAQSGWDYTSASSYVQLSFWIKSSVAFTLPFYIRSRDGSARMYSSTQALSANTWTKITRSIPGDPGGLQIDNNNDRGLELLVAPYYGTDGTASGSTLNAWKAWTSSSRFPDVATTWWDEDDATLEFTGFKLEVGSSVTDFDFKPYGEDLIRCQRYFQAHMSKENEGATFATRFTTQAQGGINYYTAFRTSPSHTLKGVNIHVMSNGANVDVTSMNMTIGGTNVTTQTSLVALITAGSLVQGDACLAHGNAGDNPMGIWLDAEL